MTVENHGPQNSLRIALRGWDAVDDRREQVVDTDPRFAACQNDFRRVDRKALLHLGQHVVDSGMHQIDFVDDRHDGKPLIGRRKGVGHCLRFNALKRIDQEHGSFAAGQTTRHLVMEVDVAGRVDEI